MSAVVSIGVYQYYFWLSVVLCNNDHMLYQYYFWLFDLVCPLFVALLVNQTGSTQYRLRKCNLLVFFNEFFVHAHASLSGNSLHTMYKLFLSAVEYLPFSSGDASKACFEEIIERFGDLVIHFAIKFTKLQTSCLCV